MAEYSDIMMRAVILNLGKFKLGGEFWELAHIA